VFQTNESKVVKLISIHPVQGAFVLETVHAGRPHYFAILAPNSVRIVRTTANEDSRISSIRMNGADLIVGRGNFAGKDSKLSIRREGKKVIPATGKLADLLSLKIDDLEADFSLVAVLSSFGTTDPIDDFFAIMQETREASVELGSSRQCVVAAGEDL
jgi:hypothetical protein